MILTQYCHCRTALHTCKHTHTHTHTRHTHKRHTLTSHHTSTHTHNTHTRHTHTHTRHTHTHTRHAHIQAPTHHTAMHAHVHTHTHTLTPHHTHKRHTHITHPGTHTHTHPGTHTSHSNACTCTHAQDGPSRSALYLLASYLPKSSVSSIVEGTLTTLSALRRPIKSQEYSSLLVALVAWEQTSHVITLANQWLEPDLCGKEPDVANDKVATVNSKQKVCTRVCIY